MEEANREVLRRVVPGKPSTFSGICASDEDTFPLKSDHEFARNIRIIALLGTQAELAAPDRDGWFVSDFLLAWHMLHGHSKAEHWLACDGMQPKQLLDRCDPKFEPHPYLQGDSKKTRKIVLDKQLLEEGRVPFITTYPADTLKDEFLKLLRIESKAALQNNEPLLVLLFAHGVQSPCSIAIGAKYLTFNDFCNAKTPDANVAIITNACYSGAWARSLYPFHTVFAASKPDEESLAWPDSGSCGRAGGSAYMSSVAKMLCGHGEQQTPLPNPLEPQESTASKMSTAEFMREIHEIMHTDHILSSECGVTFTVRENGWGNHWSTRSNITPLEFQKRFDNLRDYGPRCESESEGEGLEQSDPKVKTGGVRNSFHSTMTKFSQSFNQRFGGSSFSHKTAVTSLARQYFNSNPGRDEAAVNHSVHNMCKELLGLRKQIKEPTFDELWGLELTLRYRLDVMALANELLNGCQVPKPFGQKCEDFDPIAYGEQRRSKHNQRRYEISELVLQNWIIFPKPDLTTQGNDWSRKPSMYVEAALFEAGYTIRQAEQKLDAMVELSYAIENKTIQRAAEAPIARDKWNELFKKFGKKRLRSRSLSPVKRPATSFSSVETSRTSNNSVFSKPASLGSDDIGSLEGMSLAETSEKDRTRWSLPTQKRTG